MISKLAQVHKEAKIGEDVTIDSFSVVYEDVEIGKGTWIGPNVTIFPGARIGENCKIFPNAVIAPVPQDLKFTGEYSTVEIGNNTVIRENVTIHRATVDKLVTKVGDNCLLMCGVHLAHDVQVGNNVILANNVAVAGHCEIDDYAIVEGMCGVPQFMKIGKHAFVGAMTFVRKSVPPYVKAAREPISFVGVNTVGLRRRGFNDDSIKNIEGAYRTLFVQNQNISKGISQIKEEMSETEEINEIISFVENADKGIIRRS